MSRIRLTIFSIFILVMVEANAQDGGFAGMADASVMQGGLWSANNNQAGLSDINDISVGICYQNRFQLAETSTKSVVAAVPTKTGNFALSYNRFGYSLYSENRFGLAYARSFGDMISAGLQFDYFSINQTEAYGSKGVFLFEFGLIASPVENLQIGAHVFNPTKAKLAEYEDERVNTSFRFGLNYYFSKTVQLATELEKTMQSDMRFKVGLECQIISGLYLRTGFRCEPNEFTFGGGYVFRKLAFDLSFATHQYLPMSTQLSLNYSL